jgi:hypothetical protein
MPQHRPLLLALALLASLATTLATRNTAATAHPGRVPFVTSPALPYQAQQAVWTKTGFFFPASGIFLIKELDVAVVVTAARPVALAHFLKSEFSDFSCRTPLCNGEVFGEDQEFGSSLSSSENEGHDDDPEADEEDEGQPILWSACNDRGSNVVRGMNSLFEDKEEENGEIAVPCDANNCVCHLCIAAVVALLAGRFGAAAFASDCTVVLGVSSALQRKSEGRGLLQDVATVETSHLVPLRKSDTRWEGLHQCWGRAIEMKEAWQRFFEDKEAGQQCLEKAGIKFRTDFPEGRFWERGEFYFELLTKAHAFSKWAQRERQPNMMFLV